MERSVNIIIIGGGYVSVWAYRSLLKKLRSEIVSGKVKITVVSPYEYHSFHGWSAEGLTGVIQNINRRSPLSEVVSRAGIVKGNAEKVDTAANTVYVRIENGDLKPMVYDHLLMGFGSNDAGTIEGVKEFGFGIKSPEEFEHCYTTILKLIKSAVECEDASEAERLLTFTVAGAGMTGVELSLNLEEYLSVAKSQYPALKNVQPMVTLINSGDKVISALTPKLKRIRCYVEKTIGQSNVELISNVRLEKITQEGAFLDNGTFLPCSMVISTLGQSRLVFKGTEKMQRDITQRLCVNKFFQVPGYPNIWGGGDACNVPYMETNEACVSDALWAIKHGKYAGSNIARAIKEKPLKPFMYKGLGQAASLGMGKGIGELYGFQFTGTLAWVLRWFFFNYFMPSRRVMMRVIGDWFFLLMNGQRRGLYLFNNSIKPDHEAEITQRLETTSDL